MQAKEEEREVEEEEEEQEREDERIWREEGGWLSRKRRGDAEERECDRVATEGWSGALCVPGWKESVCVSSVRAHKCECLCVCVCLLRLCPQAQANISCIK